jgi:hypothetical protein
MIRLIGSVLLLFTAGCGSMSDLGGSTFDLGEADRIEVRSFDTFGGTGGNILAELEGEAAEETAGILSNARQESGVVDMAEGDLHLVVDGEPDRHIHLWLPEEGKAAVMDASDTHTLYTLSESRTEDLRDLLLDEGVNVET